MISECYKTDFKQNSSLQNSDVLEAVFTPFSASTTQMMLWYCYQDFLFKIFRIFGQKTCFFCCKLKCAYCTRSQCLSQSSGLRIIKNQPTICRLAIWRPLLYQLSYTPKYEVVRLGVACMCGASFRARFSITSTL